MQNILNYLSALLNKIDKSFRASSKGEEDIKILIRWWGFVAYLFFYFIVNKIIKISTSDILDLSLSSLAIAYFSWHIFALERCRPKKIKVSKEEKKRLRAEKIRNLPRSIMRKILLQEPISKWDNVSILIALDLLYIVVFLGYILE